MTPEPIFSLVNDTPPPPQQGASRQCAACSYVRQSSDNAPAWQCPRCQVAYDKVMPASTTERVQARTPKIHHSQIKPARPFPLLWAALLVVLAVMGLGVWKWRQANPSAIELAARAQGSARAQAVAAAQAQLGRETELATAQKQAQSRDGDKSGQALATLQRYADQGDPSAMVRLAVVLRQENGSVPKNHAQSMQWLHKAANEGSGAAFVQLGHVFEQGVGEQRDLAHAAEWYAKAARQGHGAGLYALGMLHAGNSAGLPKDAVRAHALLDLAKRSHENQPDPSPDDNGLMPTGKSAAWAGGALQGLAKSMSAVELVRAKALADAWQPGQPLPMP